MEPPRSPNGPAAHLHGLGVRTASRKEELLDLSDLTRLRVATGGACGSGSRRFVAREAAPRRGAPEVAAEGEGSRAPLKRACPQGDARGSRQEFAHISTFSTQGHSDGSNKRVSATGGHSGGVGKGSRRSVKAARGAMLPKMDVQTTQKQRWPGGESLPGHRARGHGRKRYEEGGLAHHDAPNSPNNCRGGAPACSRQLKPSAARGPPQVAARGKEGRPSE